MLELVRRARARLVVVLCLGVTGLWVTYSPAWATQLPDDRAYEIVSSGDKLGKEIVGSSMRTHAALSESDQLSAAVAFTSLGGFADVRGTGIGTEYLSQRTAAVGTSGWAVHAITPAQQPMSFFGATLGYDPGYQGDMSADLTHGTFRAWSPVTNDPNVADVSNLYVRSDLRQAGAGTYALATPAVSLLPPLTPALDGRPFIAGASDDFQHVIFESRQALTADARGTNVKLYKWDDGSLQLVGIGAFCAGLAGANGRSPCSAAGYGATNIRYTQRVLSNDGHRVTFSTRPRAGGLYQLDDSGTSVTGDDAIVQVNASEASSPEVTLPATFETASADGSRVFFTSAERLTDADGGGLYLWARQPSDEQQSVTVDATSGTFTLTAHAWPSSGTGDVANGSTTVSSVSGLFSVGQTIVAPDIPAGTTIVAIPNGTTLTLSAPATADATDSLSASVDATTGPLAHDATAGQVRSALENLGPIGSGNVTVTGGPGGAGGATPYVVSFTGALTGVNVARMSADGAALSGGAASAAVDTTAPLQNLTLIAGPSTLGVAGASDDGHRLYFGAGGQLVSGGPSVGSGLYYWEDLNGPPGGTLSFIGDVTTIDLLSNINGWPWNGVRKSARVTPDGGVLLFEVSDGSRLPLRYDQSRCTGSDQNPNATGSACSEAYIYRADTSTPLRPDLVCVSCNPSGAPATADAWLDIRRGASALFDGPHLSHPLADDGSRVFFTTAEALVPEDTNGKMDAYEYDLANETRHLISSGTDPFDSYFMDASAKGRDVYFLTREQLVGWDTDHGYDMYDARVGGGFPEPVALPVECAGDACQGQVAGVPAAPVSGSSAFSGVGNARSTLRSRHHRALRCKRGQVKRRVRGRTRCVKRNKAKHATKKRVAQ